MSKFEDLIGRLCPDGVIYQSIGEVCDLFAGGDIPKNRFSKEKTEQYTVPIYSNGIKENALYGYTDIRKVKAPCVTVSARGTIGYAELRKEDFYPIVRLICILPKEGLLADYLKYYIETIKFRVPTTGIPQLTVPMVSNYRIPVPPLEVQHEIVRILDKFTLLSSELTAELTARKKQYNFYRDKMLNFNKEIKMVKLNEVIKNCCSGATPIKGNSEFYDNGTVPWLRTQDVRFNEIYNVDSYITNEAVEKTGVKWIPENCVIVAISGATAGRCAINKIPLTTNQHCFNMEIDCCKAHYKYIYYCVCSRFDELIMKKQGARGDLNSTTIKNLQIPLPTLEIQERIVSVLDNFDTICADLNIGLPAEIEARQKQYEYYRDMLLTFVETGEIILDRQTDRQTDRP